MNITWQDVMKFELNDNPVIFDVGGFRGDWTEIALKKFKNPVIYVFEPIEEYYEIIKSRFENNKRVKICNFGLSDKERKEIICVDQDSSSIYKKSNKNTEIKLKSIKDFIFEEQIFNVDLIKINIEGEEYRLLEELTKNPEIAIFKNLLIQFHSFIENAKERKKAITANLSTFYDQIFNYEMIFEGWKMKDIQKTYCFGDSHISIFSDCSGIIDEKTFYHYENFISYRAGPYLAYNLNNKENLINIVNKLESNSNVLFCFGEIDCRAQVHRFIENSNYKEVIDNIILNYNKFISYKKFKNVILFSITPELKEYPHWNYYKDNLEVIDCPKGSYGERVKYKEYFNEKLKELCLKEKYTYISIYEHIVKNSKVNELYYLDDIHLINKSVHYLIKYEFLKNRLYKNE